MKKFDSSEVEAVFNSYPNPIYKKLLMLRQLIFEVASETENVSELDETLKWGEPSYLTKNGSTLRLGWKKSIPEQYAIYFHCKTKLIDTIKEVYGDIFTYEGNRAIVFNLNDDVPLVEVKHCISLSLTYHLRKNLPLLGV